MDALDVTMLTEEECIATPDNVVTDADITTIPHPKRTRLPIKTAPMRLFLKLRI